MLRRSLTILSPVLLLLLIGTPRFSSQSSLTTPARFGLKGNIGFVVTAVESLQQREIKQGDIIISVDDSCAFLSLNDLRARLNKIRVNEVIPVTVLRYSRALNSLQKLALDLKATSVASGEFSSFGLKTRPGLVVNEIDPATNQVGLRLQDVIVSAELNGGAVNVTDLQTEVRRSRIGSTVKANILRYVGSGNGYDEMAIHLRVYPFPGLKLNHAGSSAEGCPSGACQWCCNACWAQTCMESSCETGAVCAGRCIMALCA